MLAAKYEGQCLSTDDRISIVKG